MEIIPLRKDKMQFFPNSSRVHTIIWMHHMGADKAYRKKARWQLHKKARSYIEQILEATSHKTAAVLPPTSHRKNHPN